MVLRRSNMSEIALSPRGRARLSGLLEALEGLPAAFGQTIVLGMLIVNGSAAATAHNILANEALYRLGFAIPLVAVGCHVAWALLISQLFGIVNRTINQLALYAILVGCAIQALAAVVYLSPLVVLNADPRQATLATELIAMSRLTFDVYLIFFGLWCVLVGYLIFRSTFMPRVIGVLLVLDGIGWMTFLVPPFANSIYTLIAVTSGAAEVSLLLWMLVFGVNNERWYQQAGRAESSVVEANAKLTEASERDDHVVHRRRGDGRSLSSSTGM